MAAIRVIAWMVEVLSALAIVVAIAQLIAAALAWGSTGPDLGGYRRARRLWRLWLKMILIAVPMLAISWIVLGLVE